MKSSNPMNLPRDETLRLKYGPWALVTGASDGIGRAVARELAGAGLNVVLVARRQAELDTLAQQIEATCGIEARTHAADLSRADEVERLVRSCRSLDLGSFVASAGFGTSGEFTSTQVENELEMIDVNCRAVTALSHALAPRFVDRGRGGIVLMSSMLAFQGVPRAANYAATKAFVQSLAEGLRLELAPRGVDVLAVAPGPIRSGFGARANMQMGLTQAPEDIAAQIVRALGRRTTVRPGWLSKLLQGSMTGLPRSLRSRILGRVMQDMTRHQTKVTAQNA